MKKLIALTILAVSFLNFTKINALESTLYKQDQEFYHFKLLASDLPTPKINSVKVVVTVENAQITRLADFENDNIIFTNKDCENGEFFTIKNLCFTLLFSEPIQNGTELADFSVERTSFDLSMRVKIGGDSTYSDGQESYRIEKTLYENVVNKEEEDGIIELDFTPEELSGEVVSPDTNTTNEPAQGTDTQNTDSTTVIIAVILGVLLLLTLLTLVYLLLKPKTSQVAA